MIELSAYHVPGTACLFLYLLLASASPRNYKLFCAPLPQGALFFFQTRCGIRSIGEINYNLMLVLVGTIKASDRVVREMLGI